LPTRMEIRSGSSVQMDRGCSALFARRHDGRNADVVSGRERNCRRSLRDGRRLRYVIGADGRNDREVTDDSPARVSWGALAWFPDGRSIAYATNRTGGGDIYAIGADGRNRVRLTMSIDNRHRSVPGRPVRRKPGETALNEADEDDGRNLSVRKPRGPKRRAAPTLTSAPANAVWNSGV
jgi:hypothetical protein